MTTVEPRLIISLRIGASFGDHDRITSLMKIDASELSGVGPPAAVRYRKLQEGVGPRREGWSIVLVRSSDLDIGKGIEHAVNWLEMRKDSVNQLKAQNVKTEFYVSIWPDNTLGFTLSMELINRCAQLGLCMSFDCTLQVKS